MRLTVGMCGLEFSCKFDKDRGYLFAMSAPGRVELDKEILVFLDGKGEVSLSEHNHAVFLSIAPGESK